MGLLFIFTAAVWVILRVMVPYGFPDLPLDKVVTVANLTAIVFFCLGMLLLGIVRVKVRKKTEKTNEAKRRIRGGM